MSEFEKWFQKVMKSRQDRWEYVPKCDYRCGWKAALEWALSRIKDMSISYEQGHIEIREEIESFSQQSNDQS